MLTPLPVESRPAKGAGGLGWAGVGRLEGRRRREARPWRSQAGCTRVEAERGEGLEDVVACD